MLYNLRVHRKHCLRLFVFVYLFFIPTLLNRVGGRSYICIFIFYHFFLFCLFRRFKYRQMPFLRIASILLCIYSCSAVNNDSHFEGGKNKCASLNIGKITPYSSKGRDRISAFEAARDVYYHPLKINFNVCSGSYVLASTHRFT